MVTSASRSARIAAVLLFAGLGAIALLQLAWAFGVTWGLDEASGGQVTDWSIGLSVISLAVAALCAAAIIVTAARVGWLTTRLSGRALQIGVWIIFAALTLAALQNAGSSTNWERFGNASIALALALAALVVARAHPRPHAGHTSQPPATPTPVGR